MSVVTARAFGVRTGLAILVSAVLGLGLTAKAGAQGVTTGAVRGRVLDTSGQPVVGSTVVLTNRNSGSRYLGSTSANGSYFIANVVIGPYMLQARAIGFRPAGRSDVVVNLGQVTEIELRLEPATIEVEAITTTGVAENTLLAPSRTGPIAVVDSNLIKNLPSLNRNFLDFSRTSSLVNGSSIAGQSDRFNQLQIDGGSNGDLFGLNSSGGVPGGRNNSRPLSMEAVQEVQVLIAPFDVRQGGFTGGLINAVTKSGSNEFHGSAFYSLQDDALVGKDSAGTAAGEFSLGYYGFSVGGPIIRDRLHFFAAGEWRRQEQPFGGNVVIGTDTTGGLDSVGVGIRNATAQRVRDYTTTTHGFDPGAFGRPTIPNPDQNIFAKLSMQLGSRSQAELSYNRVRSNVAVLVHDPTGANPTRLREGYQYDASGYGNASQTNGMRGRLNTPIGSRLTNELIVSYNALKDEREMGSRRPVIIVGADRRATPTANPTTFLAIGGERFSHANLLEQNILEIANNLTIDLGNHNVTVGGRIERFNFLNVFFPASLGAWFFPDTTAYFTNAPTRYERALPASAIDTLGRTDGPIADFVFSQYGFYAQDAFRPSRGLTLTFGLRLDVTGLPQPTYNTRIDSAAVTVGPNAGGLFGVRTDNRPTNALLISPRFGFNYDPHGDRSTVVRGGAGIFSGRTPYVWASNAFTNTGLEQTQLTCTTTTGLPTFTVDPDNQPSACPTGGLTTTTPSIVFFDKDFKLPQNLRLSLGVDRRLPWGVLGTVDGLYTRAINQFLLEDVNLVPGGTSTGEGNRQLYGTLSGTSSTATPRRATTAARDVLRQFNSNEDYSYSVTFGLNKSFSNSMQFTASYTFAHAYDLISGTSDISNSLLNFSTLDGTFTNRDLTPSLWDIPHSIRFSGSANIPWGVRVSLFYTGNSGRPYTYRYGSDVNADGFNGNDLLYVPLNQGDISLNNPAQYPLLDAYINNEPCLREARGTTIKRGACRNPWRSFVDARAVKSFNTIRGQSVEVSASMFNLLSFLGIGGKIYNVTGFENTPLLNLARYSAALGRGVYNLALPSQLKFQDVNASRWKLELGARYIF